MKAVTATLARLLTISGLGCEPVAQVAHNSDACGKRFPHVPASGSLGDPVPPSQRTPGYLHTKGRNIVDHLGQRVKFTGVNWFGLETRSFAPHGLWARSLESMLDQMVRLGYNSIRLPFSTQLLDPDIFPPDGTIDFVHNPDLVGLTGLEIMDRVVEEAGRRGLMVLLDRHATYAASFDAGPARCGSEGIWWVEDYPEERWIRDFEFLAQRYLGQTAVIGFDVQNEPREDSTWGDDVLETDFRLAAERAGNAILAANPELLVVVEGIVMGEDPRLEYNWSWYGENLLGVRDFPVRLGVPDQLVYSIHDYPQSVSPQPWFESEDYPANLRLIWDVLFGYIFQEDMAPVLVGEFGSRLATEVDRIWFIEFIDYLTEHDLDFTVWSWNADSSDTGGVLLDDWMTVRSEFHDPIAPLLVPVSR